MNHGTVKLASLLERRTARIESVAHVLGEYTAFLALDATRARAEAESAREAGLFEAEARADATEKAATGYLALLAKVLTEAGIGEAVERIAIARLGEGGAS